MLIPNALFHSIYRKAFALCLSLFLITAFFQTLCSREEPQFPVLKGRVTDTIGLLSPAKKAALTSKLEELDQSTSAELVVAIISSTKPLSIEDYSIRLAEKWKIGKKGKDNGVLLLIARDDRKLRIEVGYGLEGFLTDARSRQVISNLMIPEFKQGNFAKGIEAGVDRLIYLIKNRPSIEEEERLEKERRARQLQEYKEKAKIRNTLQFFSYFWMVPCILLGFFLLFRDHFWKGLFGPILLYSIPIGLIGLLYDDYFLPALFLNIFYFLIYMLVAGIKDGGSSGGGSYANSGSSYSGSSYSYSSSSSSYSSSSSSYSGGGGSFGGGGASGSW